MKLIVDYRESKIINELNCMDISYETHNLTLGDIQFIDDGIHLLFERKTIQDLVSSVCDGRYKDQTTRLKKEIEPNKVYYIIEGYITDTYSIPKSTIYSILFSLQYKYGFHVLYTTQTQETALMIKQMFKKVSILDTKEICSTPVILTKKQESITPENIEIMMLSQIPKIQYHTSKQILEYIGGLKKLYETTEDELNKIKIQTKTGKYRKLSKQIIKNIIYYLKL